MANAPNIGYCFYCNTSCSSSYLSSMYVDVMPWLMKTGRQSFMKASIPDFTF